MEGLRAVRPTLSVRSFERTKLYGSGNHGDRIPTQVCSGMFQPATPRDVAAAASSAAMLNEKVEPAPGSDSTQIVPPSPSMILWQTARPRPVPGTSRVAKRTKGKNMRA